MHLLLLWRARRRDLRVAPKKDTNGNAEGCPGFPACRDGDHNFARREAESCFRPMEAAAPAAGVFISTRYFFKRHSPSSAPPGANANQGPPNLFSLVKKSPVFCPEPLEQFSGTALESGFFGGFVRKMANQIYNDDPPGAKMLDVFFSFLVSIPQRMLKAA